MNRKGDLNIHATYYENVLQLYLHMGTSFSLWSSKGSVTTDSAKDNDDGIDDGSAFVGSYVELLAANVSGY